MSDFIEENKARHELWKFFSDEHGLILTEGQIDDILAVVEAYKTEISESNNIQASENSLHIGSIANSFDCYLCGDTFNRVGEPCVHYDEDEIDEEGDVSLCDGCAEKVMSKAKENNIKGLSKRFFNYKQH